MRVGLGSEFLYSRSLLSVAPIFIPAPRSLTPWLQNRMNRQAALTRRNVLHRLLETLDDGPGLHVQGPIDLPTPSRSFGARRNHRLTTALTGSRLGDKVIGRCAGSRCTRSSNRNSGGWATLGRLQARCCFGSKLRRFDPQSSTSCPGRWGGPLYPICKEGARAIDAILSIMNMIFQNSLYPSIQQSRLCVVGTPFH